MANKRALKKNINYVLGDIIDAVYDWEYINPSKDTKKTEAVIDDAIAVFDDLIAQVNAKDIDNKKLHFKAISAQLESKGRELVERINNL